MTGDFANRHGRFKVSAEMVHDHPAVVLQVLGTVLITRCEHIFATKTFEYQGFSPQFEVVSPMEEAPIYDVEVEQGENEELTVTWKRAP